MYTLPAQRKAFLGIQCLIILMAFGEIIMIASIGFFVKILADINTVTDNAYLYKIFQSLNVPLNEFIIYLGFLVFLVVLASSIFSIFTMWKISLYGTRYGAELGDRLFINYINKPWLFHLEKNSSELTKKIVYETTRVTDQIIIPILMMDARIVLIITLSIAVLIYNPFITIVGVLIFTLLYLILYKLSSNRLLSNGRIHSDDATMRFKILSEGLGGILNVIILNKKYEYIKKFQLKGISLYKASGTNVALSIAPKYFMEFVIFSSFILLVVVLIVQGKVDLTSLLPTMSVYGVVAIKFLPSFQQVYKGLTTIKGSIAAWEEIKVDLSEDDQMIETKLKGSEKLFFKKSLNLEKISFNYPNDKKIAINNISLELPINSVIGIIGPSGSGKSTLVNIISGLIAPSSGLIYIDDEVVHRSNISALYEKIGYVPQDVFLTDQTIIENIAFGEDEDNISKARIEDAILGANLSEFIDQLPNGLMTVVGERGVQLSGGQKQRIGIARALYIQPEILIFDESTSSLDGLSEKQIMNTIDSLKCKLIIIIAHRLKTVENCDILYLIDQGEVLDKGNFDELYKRNAILRKMDYEKS